MDQFFTSQIGFAWTNIADVPQSIKVDLELYHLFAGAVAGLTFGWGQSVEGAHARVPPKLKTPRI